MLKLAVNRIALSAFVLLLAACSDDGQEMTSSTKPVSDAHEFLQSQLLAAKPGDVIEIAEGRYALKRSLSLTVDGVTIRGQGMDKTILDFSGQISGAEGLLVTASDFTIEDIAIEDAKGDALKINEGKNIVIRRVRTQWTNGPDTSNGAYGIYPVQTENTLIDGAVAIGASDAGIYVGQSRNVIVRNSRAEFNVAGIEIENTVDADVYDNVAINNTGGVLVFNMPNLSLEGKRTRIFNNVIKDNNTANFAAPGGAVAGVPAGSGVSINSNDQVEVFNNTFANNQTAHITVSSVYSTNYSDRDNASAFDPYPETIFIHGNQYEGGGDNPDTEYLPKLKDAVFGVDGVFPAVIWDGFINPEKSKGGLLLPAFQICISDEASTAVFDVDAANGFANPQVRTEPHNCRHDALPKVDLPIVELALGD